MDEEDHLRAEEKIKALSAHHLERLRQSQRLVNRVTALLCKALIIAVVVGVVSLVPPRLSPLTRNVRHALLSRTWDVVNVLLVALAVTYGVLGRGGRQIYGEADATAEDIAANDFYEDKFFEYQSVSGRTDIHSSADDNQKREVESLNIREEELEPERAQHFLVRETPVALPVESLNIREEEQEPEPERAQHFLVRETPVALPVESLNIREEEEEPEPAQHFLVRETPVALSVRRMRGSVSYEDLGVVDADDGGGSKPPQLMVDTDKRARRRRRSSRGSEYSTPKAKDDGDSVPKPYGLQDSAAKSEDSPEDSASKSHGYEAVAVSRQSPEKAEVKPSNFYFSDQGKPNLGTYEGRHTLPPSPPPTPPFTAPSQWDSNPAPYQNRTSLPSPPSTAPPQCDSNPAPYQYRESSLSPPPPSPPLPAPPPSLLKHRMRDAWDDNTTEKHKKMEKSKSDRKDPRNPIPTSCIPLSLPTEIRRQESNRLRRCRSKSLLKQRMRDASDVNITEKHKELEKSKSDRKASTNPIPTSSIPLPLPTELGKQESNRHRRCRSKSLLKQRMRDASDANITEKHKELEKSKLDRKAPTNPIRTFPIIPPLPTEIWNLESNRQRRSRSKEDSKHRRSRDEHKRRRAREIMNALGLPPKSERKHNRIPSTPATSPLPSTPQQQFSCYKRESKHKNKDSEASPRRGSDKSSRKVHSSLYPPPPPPPAPAPAPLYSTHPNYRSKETSPEKGTPKPPIYYSTEPKHQRNGNAETNDAPKPRKDEAPENRDSSKYRSEIVNGDNNAGKTLKLPERKSFSVPLPPPPLPPFPMFDHQWPLYDEPNVHKRRTSSPANLAEAASEPETEPESGWTFVFRKQFSLDNGDSQFCPTPSSDEVNQKADAFIARFHEQMRLQKLDSVQER